MEIYKTIKRCPKYEISSRGTVREIKTKNELLVSITPDGYSVVYIKGYDFYPKLRIHRLVYETFHEEDIKGQEVDHVDGNKSNNSLSNLEVVSHRENMIRAVNNKLITNNRSIEVYDTKLNKTHKLRSVTEFEQLIGKNQTYLIPRIKHSNDKLILDRYKVINPPKSFETLVNSGGKKPIPIKVLNKKTNSEVIYSSMSSACYDLGVSVSFIRKRLQRGNPKRIDSFPYEVYLVN